MHLIYQLHEVYEIHLAKSASTQSALTRHVTVSVLNVTDSESRSHDTDVDK